MKQKYQDNGRKSLIKIVSMNFDEARSLVSRSRAPRHRSGYRIKAAEGSRLLKGKYTLRKGEIFSFFFFLSFFLSFFRSFRSIRSRRVTVNVIIEQRSPDISKVISPAIQRD